MTLPPKSVLLLVMYDRRELDSLEQFGRQNEARLSVLGPQATGKAEDWASPHPLDFMAAERR